MPIQIGLPFKDFLQNLMAEIIKADAEMQINQRLGWQGINKDFPTIEGFDRLENLGVKEVTLTFWMKPMKFGFFSRLWILLQYLFGKSPKIAFSLVRPLIDADKNGLEVKVVVSRDRNDRFTTDSNLNPELQKDSSVLNIFL
jgi:hypothetical protein